MRVAFLLFIGLTVPFVHCRTSAPDHAAIYRSHLTLDKYSYLIIGLGHTTRNSTVKAVTSGTAFFIQKNKKIFLVTAYHILTGCVVDTVIKRNEIVDSLDLSYTDRWGFTKHQILPLTAHKNLPCRSYEIFPDIDTMDVTQYFKNEKIFSIEQLIPDHQNGSPDIQIKDEVICYGYPEIDLGKYSPADQYIENPKFISGHIFETAAIYKKPKYSDSIGMLYHIIFPVLIAGYSGAPVFRIRSDASHKRIVEFAGIQSGTDTFFNCSWVVKDSLLKKMLQLK